MLELTFICSNIVLIRFLSPIPVEVECRGGRGGGGGGGGGGRSSGGRGSSGRSSSSGRSFSGGSGRGCVQIFTTTVLQKDNIPVQLKKIMGGTVGLGKKCQKMYNFKYAFNVRFRTIVLYAISRY